MMLSTTVRTFLVAALFSLPLSMPLHADEDGLPNELSFVQGQNNAVKILSSEDTDVKNDESKDADEGAAAHQDKEPTSPSDEGDVEQTPPTEKKEADLNPGDDESEQDNPSKPNNKEDENAVKGFFGLDELTYMFNHCPILFQKLYESVWFQVQTVGALTVIPFMTYKTLIHLKKLFADKKERSKHAVRTLLYATSGIITLKAFMQYVQELNAGQAAQL